MSRESRGRCVPCGIVWVWVRGRRNVVGTKCPDCGLQLAATSQNALGPHRDFPETPSPKRKRR